VNPRIDWRQCKWFQDYIIKDSFDDPESRNGKLFRKRFFLNKSIKAEHFKSRSIEEMRHDRMLPLEDEDFLDEDDDGNEDSPDKASTGKNKSKIIDDNESDEEEEDKSVNKHTSHRVKEDKSGPVLYSVIPNYPQEKIVLKYFKSLLKQWEQDLNSREDHIKLSMKGKMDIKIQKQCKDYMRPLLRMCKKRQMDSPDILDHLVEIVKLCEQGNFRLVELIYVPCLLIYIVYLKFNLNVCMN
jgi:hypothetical protein